MANTKSAQKRARTSKVRRLINVARSSEVKTMSKKVLDALAANDVELAKQTLQVAEAKIARAGQKGVLKRNTAARKISRLAKRVAAASAAEATT